MSENYLCIHGHFYQPPRENPWLGVIEYQPSASPYHDWNERVTRECYGPNTRARLESGERRIVKLVNNYEYMNFDFGPTLLSWLEKKCPWVYQEIITADRASVERYHGHGNAMAQVYNHIIMPLATPRDKLTQIRWGLADFARRFGRRAEGMWLAETAVDLESLALMAQEGVRFTVLAPSQAEAVRALGDSEENWKDVSGGGIDTTRPYRVFPKGYDWPAIDVFFFDAELSKAVAYEKILASGSGFLARLERTGADAGDGASLINIATDGESYGHHFKFGDMALAWIYDYLEQKGKLKPINYGSFLARFPAKEEVRIAERTSWSCAHGVDRWHSDCGCNVGHREGWTQAWRAPLREAVDWLSGELATLFTDEGEKIFKDPWKARDEYIELLLDPSQECRERFFAHHLAINGVDEDEKVAAVELMESQRMGLYMQTSCGWFFDDIGGLEATQVLLYADRAIDLVKRWSRSNLEKTFTDILSRAKSNDPALGDGAALFEKRVRARRIFPGKIAANWAFLRQFHGEALFDEVLCEGDPASVKSRNCSDQKNESLRTVLFTDPMTGKDTKRTLSVSGETVTDFTCDIFDEQGNSTTYGFDDMIPDTRKEALKGTAEVLLKQASDHLNEQDLFSIFYLEPAFEKTKQPLSGGVREIVCVFLRGRFLGLSDSPEEVLKEMLFLKGFVRQVRKCEPPLRLDDPEMRGKGQKVVRDLMSEVAKGEEKTTMTTLVDFLDFAESLKLKMDLWECQNRYWDLSRDQHFMKQLPVARANAFNALGKRLGFVR
jgi:alpha-amylase/alpha-mannosidase (GH57 family)